METDGGIKKTAARTIDRATGMGQVLFRSRTCTQNIVLHVNAERATGLFLAGQYTLAEIPLKAFCRAKIHRPTVATCGCVPHDGTLFRIKRSIECGLVVEIRRAPKV